MKDLSSGPVPISSTVTSASSSAWMTIGSTVPGSGAAMTKESALLASLPAASVTMTVAVAGPAESAEPSKVKSPSASGLPVTSVRVAPPSKLSSILTTSASTPPRLKLIEAATDSPSVRPTGPSSARSPSSSAEASAGGIGPEPAAVISIRSRLGPVLAPAGIERAMVFSPAWSVTVRVSERQLSKPSSGPDGPSGSVEAKAIAVAAAAPLIARSSGRAVAEA